VQRGGPSEIIADSERCGGEAGVNLLTMEIRINRMTTCELVYV